MPQIIFTIIIISVTVFFVIRWIVRTLKGNGDCCSCGCDHCPMKCNERKLFKS